MCIVVLETIQAIATPMYFYDDDDVDDVEEQWLLTVTKLSYRHMMQWYSSTLRDRRAFLLTWCCRGLFIVVFVLLMYICVWMYELVSCLQMCVCVDRCLNYTTYNIARLYFNSACCGLVTKNLSVLRHALVFMLHHAPKMISRELIYHTSHLFWIALPDGTFYCSVYSSCN